MAEPCIKRRMLFACREAYFPAGWQPPADENPGWISPPQVFVAADPLVHGKIDSARIGRIPEGILLAFRGTLPPIGAADPPLTVFLDWANDADLLPLEDKTYPGRVHRGFHNSLERLWTDIRPAIERLLDEKPSDNTLFVTGHSKGGALANLAAWRALKIGRLASPIRVYTIAAARAGDADFRTGFETHGAIHCVRYESAFDLVPRMPFGADTPSWVKALAAKVWGPLKDLGYAPVGQRMRPHVSWLEALAAMRRYVSWLGIGGPRTQYLPLVVQAHSIGPKSGYDTLVCSGEDPPCAHT